MTIFPNIIAIKLPKLLIFTEWILLGLITILIFRGIFFPLDPIIPCSKTFLADSSSTTLPGDTSHKQFLLDAVHVHLSYAEENNISRESLRMQGRFIFISLFVALITIIISIKNEHGRTILSCIVALFGLFWYILNVHMTDIENRSQIITQMLYNTEYKLLDANLDNTRNYYFDFSRTDTVYSQPKNKYQPRKIKSFFTPNFEQILFNLTPICILLILNRSHNKIIPKTRRRKKLLISKFGNWRSKK